MVVDSDVQVLVANAAHLPGAIAMDAVAGFDDPRQTLDTEVDQVTGMGMLIAHHRRRRIERARMRLTVARLRPTLMRCASRCNATGEEPEPFPTGSSTPSPDFARSPEQEGVRAWPIPGCQLRCWHSP